MGSGSLSYRANTGSHLSVTVTNEGYYTHCRPMHNIICILQREVGLLGRFAHSLGVVWLLRNADDGKDEKTVKTMDKMMSISLSSSLSVWRSSAYWV